MSTCMMQSRQTESPSELLEAVVKTRVALSDNQVLTGELLDFEDSHATIAGPTDPLTVGDEIWLALLFSYTFSIECLCEVTQVQPGESYSVAFKTKFKRCLMWPPNRPVS